LLRRAAIPEALVVVGSIAAATLFGSMFFLLFGGRAPGAHQPRADGGRALHPRPVPLVLPVVLLLAAIAAAALALGRPVDAAIMGLIALGALVSRQLPMARINAHRDMALAGVAVSARRFERLHRVSVWINDAQLLAAFAVLFRTFVD
jgi:hypothetical protein